MKTMKVCRGAKSSLATSLLSSQMVFQQQLDVLRKRLQANREALQGISATLGREASRGDARPDILGTYRAPGLNETKEVRAAQFACVVREGMRACPKAHR